VFPFSVVLDELLPLVVPVPTTVVEDVLAPAALVPVVAGVAVVAEVGGARVVAIVAVAVVAVVAVVPVVEL